MYVSCILGKPSHTEGAVAARQPWVSHRHPGAAVKQHCISASIYVPRYGTEHVFSAAPWGTEA